MNPTVTADDVGQDLATAKHWRNRWYLKDGRSVWGHAVFPSHQDAAREASDTVRDWEACGWAHTADGTRFPASQFRMVLQLPVGDLQ